MTRRLNIPFAEEFASNALQRPVTVEVCEPPIGANGCIGPARAKPGEPLYIHIAPHMLLDLGHVPITFLHECVHGIGGACGKHDSLATGSRLYLLGRLSHDLEWGRPLPQGVEFLADSLTPCRRRLLADWYREVEATTTAYAQLWLIEINRDRLAAGLVPFEDELVIIEDEVDPYQDVIERWLGKENDNDRKVG